MSDSTASHPVLDVRRLERWLGEGAARQHVLRGVDLTLPGPGIYAITGPSGCGKSTLLYLLGQLDRPDGGEIHLRGQRVDHLGEGPRTELRRMQLGFIFQFHFLLAELTALENVMLPLLRINPQARTEAEARARDLLAKVGLKERLQNRGHQLSGGERQRVAVARALVHRPALILADEPTGNLDQANSENLFGLLHDLTRTEACTILIVTHDRELAQRCDCAFPMQDGVFLDPGHRIDA